MPDASLTLPTADSAAVIDRLFDALSRGDVAAARDCCTPDLVVWHGFDQQPLDADAAGAAWEDLVAGFPERAFVDVRRTPVPGGWVQRHRMVARTATGTWLAWPVALFLTLRSGLVARLDEYIDRAGRQELAGPDPGWPRRH